MPDPEAPEVVKSIEAHRQAEHYRTEAARLRGQANREPLAKMRRHLLRLAAEYERLAEEAAISA